MSRATLLLAPLAALTLAACGGSSEPTAEPAPEPSAVAESPAPAASSEAAEATASGPRLPDVRVEDLSGGELSVASLAPSERPVLVWFWAPHCSVCNAEAKSVEAFAKRVQGELDVVGLGAQDDEQMARDFVAEHGLKTPRMLYDASFESWRALGINGQPAAVLFDRDGVAREAWFGAFPEDEVVDLARSLA